MLEAPDLKNVIDDIISSYEAKVQSIGSIFDTTHLILNDFQESVLTTKEERDKINAQLREILAKNQHLRRKDFDNMMQDVLSAQDQKEKEVRNLLKEYFDGQKAMAQALRENLEKFKDSLTKGETERVKECHALIKDIIAKQEVRKQEITTRLKEFQKQQRYLPMGLKRLLEMGNELRIKDFKLMLEEFKAQREKRLALQKKRKEEVAKMLKGFREKRKRMHFSPKTIPHIKKKTDRSPEPFNGVNIDVQGKKQELIQNKKI